MGSPRKKKKKSFYHSSLTTIKQSNNPIKIMQEETNSIIFARDDLIQPYSAQEISFLQRRKGGGGGRGGGGGFGGVSSSSGGRSSSSSSGGTTSGGRSSSASKGFTPGSVSGGRNVYGSTGGFGIPNRYSITSGSFVGRQAGGGTRNNVYGSPYYGSGYTNGYASRGLLAGGAVGGLGFPFIFWPVAFGGYGGYYGSRELNRDDRPGGNVTQYTLTPPDSVTNTSANQFALYGDANSVDQIFQLVKEDCGVQNQLAANFTINPNQAVQYYRGSSFAILLNGYNNTQPNVEGDVSGNTTSAVYSAPPPAITTVQGVDTSYFDCLNSTTGKNVPLVDGAFSINQNNLMILLPAVFVTMLINIFS